MCDRRTLRLTRKKRTLIPPPSRMLKVLEEMPFVRSRSFQSGVIRTLPVATTGDETGFERGYIGAVASATRDRSHSGAIARAVNLARTLSTLAVRWHNGLSPFAARRKSTGRKVSVFQASFARGERSST